MKPDAAGLAILAAIGLVAGSFLATLVLRLPKGQPIVFARSACPACGHVLGPLELIPIASWLIQGRRCRACGVAIPAYYPAMEIACALVAIASGWRTSGWMTILLCAGGWTVVTLAGWAWTGANKDAA